MENVTWVSTLVQQRNPPAEVPGSSMEIQSVTWVYCWGFNNNMETVDLFLILGSCPCFLVVCICPWGLFPGISSLSSVPSCPWWLRVRQVGRALLCQTLTTCWGTEHPSCQKQQLLLMLLLTKPLPGASHVANVWTEDCSTLVLWRWLLTAWFYDNEDWAHSGEKRKYKIKVRNSRSLGEEPPAPGFAPLALGSSLTRLGHLLALDQHCQTSPFPAGTQHFSATMLGGQWLPGWEESGLSKGRRSPAWPGDFISAPDLARNGFTQYKALSHGNKVIELSWAKFLIFLQGSWASRVSHSDSQAVWEPSSPASVADSPPPSLNLPAEPLSTVQCIQNDMPVVSKKPSAWWSLGPWGDAAGHTDMQVFRWWLQAGWVTTTHSPAFPIPKSNTILSTVACTNEEVLMASREKLACALSLWELRFLQCKPFLSVPWPRAGLLAWCYRSAQGSLSFCKPHFTPQNKGSKPTWTKASWDRVAPGLPDTWCWG